MDQSFGLLTPAFYSSRMPTNAVLGLLMSLLSVLRDFLARWLPIRGAGIRDDSLWKACNVNDRSVPFLIVPLAAAARFRGVAKPSQGAADLGGGAAIGSAAAWAYATAQRAQLVYGAK